MSTRFSSMSGQKFVTQERFGLRASMLFSAKDAFTTGTALVTVNDSNNKWMAQFCKQDCTTMWPMTMIGYMKRSEKAQFNYCTSVL